MYTINKTPLRIMEPSNLLEQNPLLKCTFGCPVLDSHFAGGVPVNSITELVAESSCGKTQLSLQLLLSCQLPVSQGGLSSSSIYFHSEFPFPHRRLHQLSLSFTASHPLYIQHNPCDHVFVQGVHSADQLLDILSKLDSMIQNPPTRLPIRLIVIDSIAALFRSEFENTSLDLKRRSSLFFKISARLKELANRFGLAVVVTNQVVDLVSPEGMNGLRIGNTACLYSSGRKVCPALGISWANCINSRLFLSRIDAFMSENSEGRCSRTRRRIQVVFAPHLPASSCEFIIKKEGVFGVQK